MFFYFKGIGLCLGPKCYVEKANSWHSHSRQLPSVASGEMTNDPETCPAKAEQAMTDMETDVQKCIGWMVTFPRCTAATPSHRTAENNTNHASFL